MIIFQILMFSVWEQFFCFCLRHMHYSINLRSTGCFIKCKHVSLILDDQGGQLDKELCSFTDGLLNTDFLFHSLFWLVCLYVFFSYIRYVYICMHMCLYVFYMYVLMCVYLFIFSLYFDLYSSDIACHFDDCARLYVFNEHISILYSIL